MTDEILSEREIEVFVRSWTLLPSSGGRFEVTVNGEVIFSKKAMGRHAEAGEIRAIMLKKVAAVRPAGFKIEKDE